MIDVVFEGNVQSFVLGFGFFLLQFISCYFVCEKKQINTHKHKKKQLNTAAATKSNKSRKNIKLISDILANRQKNSRRKDA